METEVIDIRLNAIKHWVKSELKLENYQIEAASADASFRRYFRLTSGDRRWIIMDAPPDKEDCQAFVYVAKLIESVGVQSPHIGAFDAEQGFMQLSDLGTQAYLDKLNLKTVDSLYIDAIQALIKMQTLSVDLPRYNAELLISEMALFSEWYLQKHLNLTLDDVQIKIIADAIELLAVSALQQPAVFVHRDYHSRNLMVTAENNPGVIDFQDAVNGPYTYDLVSLIKDCYIVWPRQKQLMWVDQFLALSPINIDKSDFVKQLDFMCLQRHMKAIGIFARLKHRDEKPDYLKDIPRTLAYVFDVCQRYDGLANFSKLLSTFNLPVDLKTLEWLK